MKTGLPPLLPLLLAFVMAPAPAVAAPPVPIERMTWISGELAADGKPVGRPFVPALVAYLQSQWPEVPHTVVHANPLRAWQLIGSGEPACLISSVRTPEREKLAYFTDILIGPPQQVLVRRERARDLPRNAAGEVDLARLLADARLRGAVVDGRSYGSFIDRLLLMQPTSPTLTRYAARDFGSKMLTMLVLGRADYTIGYDVSLSMDTDGGGPLPAASLVSEPIAGASAPAHAGVACPRNAWGLAAIQRIDKILGTPAGAALLREEGLRWLSPEARQRYGAQIDSFYLERARPSPIR